MSYAEGFEPPDTSTGDPTETETDRPAADAPAERMRRRRAAGRAAPQADPAPAARVPLGPRADRAHDRPAHGRGGLRGRRRGRRGDDPAKLLDELGDLLFQVYFLSLLLEEQGDGDLDASPGRCTRSSSGATRTSSGRPRRGRPGGSASGGRQIKSEQEGRRASSTTCPSSLPALLHARKVQRAPRPPATTGPTSRGPLAKVREELDELLAEVARAVGPQPRPSRTRARSTSSATCSSPSSTSRAR